MSIIKESFIYWAIPWENFKQIYNIKPELARYDKCITIEDKEQQLKEYYKKFLKRISFRDFEKISLEDFEYYKKYEKEYIENLKQNKTMCITTIYIYMDLCHLKEAFKSFKEYEDKMSNNLESYINDKQQKEDKEFNNAVKQHQRYKFWYYFGLIAWMTSCFWAPFLIGIINFAIDNINSALPMDNLWVGGIAYVLAFSFTMPVTIPLSFLIGAFVHPKILKSMIFTKDKPYCENLMKELNHSTKQENLNSASIVAGTLLEKYLK